MKSSKEILILELVSFATCCRLEKNGLSKKISLDKITTCDVFHHRGLNFSGSVGAQDFWREMLFPGFLQDFSSNIAGFSVQVCVDFICLSCTSHF
jgi:hypothetical protein